MTMQDTDCAECGGTLREGLVEYWDKKDGKWVLLRNVPAWVCDDCGDETFSHEVAERVADLLDQSGENPTGSDYLMIYDLNIIENERQRGVRPVVVQIPNVAQAPQQASIDPDVHIDQATSQTNVTVSP